tara:strand:- start:2012 stop:2422 length:411 start_codon:yes stop_codon:yes gene_type:complete
MTEALAEVTSVGVETNDEKRVAKKMPEPKGYKLLIGIPHADRKTSGGILKAKTTVEMEEVGSIIGVVLAMGPDAYRDEKRFPSGPYCKVEDCIVMRSYSGTRFRVTGEEDEYQEFRLINDDSVEAVVEDPRGVKKV